MLKRVRALFKGQHGRRRKPPPLSWPSNADIASVEEVVRQGELRLQVQLDIALASDARALSQANTLTALGAGIATAGASYAIFNGTHVSVLVASLVSAIGVFGAAALSGYAARPGRISPAGLPPENLAPWADSKPKMLAYTAAAHNQSLYRNERNALASARCVRAAYLIAAISVAIPAIGLEVWDLWTSSSHRSVATVDRSQSRKSPPPVVRAKALAPAGKLAH